MRGMTTGDDLRRLREDAELTQAQVAERMGSTQQHVSTIEGKAKVRRPTADRYRAAVLPVTHTPTANQA